VKSSMFEDSFIQSYLDMVPQPDEQSNIVFWDKDVLNEIDSDHVKQAHSNTHAFYRGMFNQLVNDEKSPFKDKNSIQYGEFLWALNTVSSRHVVMHEQQMDKDPNMLLILMPFLDLLNHSHSPNVAITPYLDKLSN